MDKEQALHNFWNSFGIPAYDETTVPDKAAFPYITYSVSTDSLDNMVSLHANLWYKSTSWKAITEKAEAIAERVKGNGYELAAFDGGYIYLTGGTPFAQRIADPEADIKRIYINIEAEFLCAY